NHPSGVPCQPLRQCLKILILITKSLPRDMKHQVHLGNRGLLDGVKIEDFEDPEYTLIIGWGTPSAAEQRKHRLANKTDPIFLGLLEVLGHKNSQDAFHIYTAEKNGCFCFLTMDFRLIRAIRSQKGRKAIKALSTRIMSPEEFGLEFDISPVSLRLFSFHGASFPVLSGKNWPGSKRRRPRRHDT
ncbi:MAG: hypothetical protein QGF53_10115, partial [Alphaproteobacteria bacterium]|nr:hypothetical protein [Alphaproteobacteria bacterium]